MKKENVQEQEVLKILNNLPLSAEEIEKYFNYWKTHQSFSFVGEDLHDEDRDNEESASQIFDEPLSNEPL